MKFKFEVKDLFKLPNILCYIRIALVPLFVYLYFTAEEPVDYYVATLVVMLSGITDFLDGQIARRCNMITDLDKLMQLAMLVTLAINIPYMCILAVYLIVKEVVMALMGLVVMKRANRRLDGAKWYGKVCTFVLYVIMIAFILLPDIPSNIRTILFALCLISLAVSFIMYIRIYAIMIADTKKRGDAEFKVY